MAPWLAALAVPSIELAVLAPPSRRWAQRVIFAAVLAAALTCVAATTERVPDVPRTPSGRTVADVLDRIAADRARAALARLDASQEP